MNNHNIKKLIFLEMHKVCHVATFNYVTCHNIKPFKMKNKNKNFVKNAQIMLCGKN
jgi:hypothetical protein